MDLRDRLPYLLALPVALALGGASSTPTSPVQVGPRAAEDTVIAWRVLGRAVQAMRDTTVRHGGAASAHVIASVPNREVSGGEGGGRGGRGGGGRGGPPRVRPALFEQTLNAVPYRERRVRVSIWIRTRLPDKPAKDMPTSQAHAFLRIENEDASTSSYDGSTISPLYGTTDWTRKVMILEVPPDAYAISFGVGVLGPGEVWVDDVMIEDQGPASGAYAKLPQYTPEQQASATPEQVAQAKEFLARRVAAAKERPTEVTNGDFETR